jgi:hypothetical protein
VIGRLRNITSGAECKSDSMTSKGSAWALSDLPLVLFPKAAPATAVAAVDALLELASLAKATPDDPPILPARVHMLFRGLPGLWACANPQCSEIAEAERGGPTGALYAEPRQSCACGSQVYELHICLAHPFLENEPCSARARKLAAGKATIPVDILLVLRALPIASNVAVSAPNVDLTVGLKGDANGVPELTAVQAVLGDIKPTAAAPRFSVPDAENGDFLFRLDANTLSGKKGDGSGEVPKGTMCLFRPFSGDLTRTDAYREGGRGISAGARPRSADGRSSSQDR